MRFKTLSFLNLLVLVLGISSCASVQRNPGLAKKITAQEYLEWYRSAQYPYRDTVVIESLTYVCGWVPAQVEVARQLTNQLIEKEEAKILLKEENVLQFELQLLLPQAGTDVFQYKLGEREDINSRTAYFSFGIKQDLSLQLKQSGKVACSALHFERGITGFPISKMLTYFPSEKAQIQSLVFYDRIFAKREIIFDFSNHSDHLPQLKL